MNQNNMSEAVKDVLTKEGYIYQEAKLTQRDNDSIWVERFVKKPLGNKSEASYIYVDLIYQETENTPLEVRIYNVYKGDKPEIKPLLIEIADKIERDIKGRVPGVMIIRKEGLAGLPFI
jgi:ribosomal protein S8